MYRLWVITCWESYLIFKGHPRSKVLMWTEILYMTLHSVFQIGPFLPWKLPLEWFHTFLIISLNEVFTDIMVLASPSPRPPPPLDLDDFYTPNRKIFDGSLSNFIGGQIPPWGTWLLKFDTLPSTRTTAFAAKRCSVSPKCNISASHGPIAFKFYTEATTTYRVNMAKSGQICPNKGN